MIKSSYSITSKVVALLTVFIFCATNLTYAQGPLQVPLPADQKLSLPIPEHLNIPDDIGSIQEEYQSEKKGPFVVFIQDAHVIVDAQSNIENLIRHLQTKYGISLVALEGGKGKMDPTLLRTFPDGNIKKRVMDGYLARGEVTGGELSAVLNEKEAKYFGIEDWKLYEENYVAFLRAMQRKEMMLAELEEKKQGLDEQRKTVYSEAHNEFHTHVQAFREEKEHLMTLLQYLKSVDSAQSMADEKNSEQPRGIGAKDKYPHLWVLYKSIDKDSKIDRGSISIEIKQLAARIQKKHGRGMAKEQTMEWNSKYQDFVTGRLDEGTYLKYVLKVAGELNEPVELTAGMRELLGHVETMATIKGTKMFSELEEFINDLEEGMMKSDEERKVSETYKRLLIMKDLAGLELSREKLEKMQSDVKAYLGLLRRPGLADSALEFYRLAVERDRALQRNLLDLMKREGEQSAIVLAGGFHTEGFAKGLKEEGCSYVLVTPRINSLKGHELYEEVMKGKLSYKDMIKTTFYDAFMRHSSMKLVAELNERDFRKVVKEWRDGVIRKLAEEGRTAEAGEYTKYIDLLMKVYIEKYGVEALTSKSKEEVLKDIEKALSDYEEKTLNGMWERFEGTLKRFTEGAQGLIDRKEVSVESVGALLRAATMPGELAAGGRLDSRQLEAASPVEQTAVKASKLATVTAILGGLTADETKHIIRLAGDVSAEGVGLSAPLENWTAQAAEEVAQQFFTEKVKSVAIESISRERIEKFAGEVDQVVAGALESVAGITSQVPAEVRTITEAETSPEVKAGLSKKLTGGIQAATGLTKEETYVAVKEAFDRRQEQRDTAQPANLATAKSAGEENRATALNATLPAIVALLGGEKGADGKMKMIASVFQALAGIDKSIQTAAETPGANFNLETQLMNWGIPAENMNDLSIGLRSVAEIVKKNIPDVSLAELRMLINVALHAATAKRESLREAALLNAVAAIAAELNSVKQPGIKKYDEKLLGMLEVLVNPEGGIPEQGDTDNRIKFEVGISNELQNKETDPNGLAADAWNLIRIIVERAVADQIGGVNMTLVATQIQRALGEVDAKREVADATAAEKRAAAEEAANRAADEKAAAAQLAADQEWEERKEKDALRKRQLEALKDEVLTLLTNEDPYPRDRFDNLLDLVVLDKTALEKAVNGKFESVAKSAFDPVRQLVREKVPDATDKEIAEFVATFYGEAEARREKAAAEKEAARLADLGALVPVVERILKEDRYFEGSRDNNPALGYLDDIVKEYKKGAALFYELTKTTNTTGNGFNLIKRELNKDPNSKDLKLEEIAYVIGRALPPAKGPTAKSIGDPEKKIYEAMTEFINYDKYGDEGAVTALITRLKAIGAAIDANKENLNGDEREVVEKRRRFSIKIGDVLKKLPEKISDAVLGNLLNQLVDTAVKVDAKYFNSEKGFAREACGAIIRGLVANLLKKHGAETDMQLEKGLRRWLLGEADTKALQTAIAEANNATLAELKSKIETPAKAPTAAALGAKGVLFGDMAMVGVAAAVPFAGIGLMIAVNLGTPLELTVAITVPVLYATAIALAFGADKIRNYFRGGKVAKEKPVPPAIKVAKRPAVTKVSLLFKNVSLLFTGFGSLLKEMAPVFFMSPFIFAPVGLGIALYSGIAPGLAVGISIAAGLAFTVGVFSFFAAATKIRAMKTALKMKVSAIDYEPVFAGMEPGTRSPVYAMNGKKTSITLTREEAEIKLEAGQAELWMTNKSGYALKATVPLVWTRGPDGGKYHLALPTLPGPSAQSIGPTTTAALGANLDKVRGALLNARDYMGNLAGMIQEIPRAISESSEKDKQGFALIMAIGLFFGGISVLLPLLGAVVYLFARVSQAVLAVLAVVIGARSTASIPTTDGYIIALGVISDIDRDGLRGDTSDAIMKQIRKDVENFINGEHGFWQNLAARLFKSNRAARAAIIEDTMGYMQIKAVSDGIWSVNMRRFEVPPTLEMKVTATDYERFLAKMPDRTRIPVFNKNGAMTSITLTPEEAKDRLAAKEIELWMTNIGSFAVKATVSLVVGKSGIGLPTRPVSEGPAAETSPIAPTEPPSGESTATPVETEVPEEQKADSITDALTAFFQGVDAGNAEDAIQTLLELEDPRIIEGLFLVALEDSDASSTAMRKIAELFQAEDFKKTFTDAYPEDDALRALPKYFVGVAVELRELRELSKRGLEKDDFERMSERVFSSDRTLEYKFADAFLERCLIQPMLPEMRMRALNILAPRLDAPDNFPKARLAFFDRINEFDLDEEQKEQLWENVTKRLEYFFDDNGEPAKMDALIPAKSRTEAQKTFDFVRALAALPDEIAKQKGKPMTEDERDEYAAERAEYEYDHLKWDRYVALASQDGALDNLKQLVVDYGYVFARSDLSDLSALFSSEDSLGFIDKLSKTGYKFDAADIGDLLDIIKSKNRERIGDFIEELSQTGYVFKSADSAALIKVADTDNLRAYIKELSARGGYVFKAADVGALIDVVDKKRQGEVLAGIGFIRAAASEYVCENPADGLEDAIKRNWIAFIVGRLVPHYQGNEEFVVPHYQDNEEFVGEMKTLVKSRIIEMVPELETGLKYEGEEINADILTGRFFEDRAWRIPKLAERFLSVLKNHQRHSSEGQFPGLVVDTVNAKTWEEALSYESTEKLDMEGFRKLFVDYGAGNIAMHQVKGKLGILSLLISGYLLPASYLQSLNGDDDTSDSLNRIRELLTSVDENIPGVLSSDQKKEKQQKEAGITQSGESVMGSFALAPTTRTHWTLNNTNERYNREKYGLCNIPSQLLRNHSFVTNFIVAEKSVKGTALYDVEDWPVGGFSNDPADLSHRVPASSGVLLIPIKEQAEFEDIFGKIEGAFPGWTRPDNIFWYEGKNVREGQEKLREFLEANMSADSRGPGKVVKVSELPSVVNISMTTASGTYKPFVSDYLGRPAGYPDFGIGPRNKEDYRGVSNRKTAQAQQFMGSLTSIAETMAKASFGSEVRSVQPSGTVRRETFLPRYDGFPSDYRVMVGLNAAPAADKTAQLMEKLKEKVKELAKTHLDENVEWNVHAETIERGDGGRSVKLRVYRGTDISVPLFMAEVVLSRQEDQEKVLNYDKTFEAQMKRIYTGLPDEDQEKAKQHILAEILKLKARFAAAGGLRRNDGGFGDVGTEQLIMRLGESAAKEGKKIGSLDDVRAIFTMDNALRAFAEGLFDEEGRFIGLENYARIFGDYLVMPGLSENETGSSFLRSLWLDKILEGAWKIFGAPKLITPTAAATPLPVPVQDEELALAAALGNEKPLEVETMRVEGVKLSSVTGADFKTLWETAPAFKKRVIAISQDAFEHNKGEYKLNEKDLEDAIGAASFEESYLMDKLFLDKPNTIFVIARDSNGEMLGYMYGVPLKDLVKMKNPGNASRTVVPEMARREGKQAAEVLDRTVHGVWRAVDIKDQRKHVGSLLREGFYKMAFDAGYSYVTEKQPFITPKRELVRSNELFVQDKEHDKHVYPEAYLFKYVDEKGEVVVLPVANFYEDYITQLRDKNGNLVKPLNETPPFDQDPNLNTARLDQLQKIAAALFNENDTPGAYKESLVKMAGQVNKINEELAPDKILPADKVIKVSDMAMLNSAVLFIFNAYRSGGGEKWLGKVSDLLEDIAKERSKLDPLMDTHLEMILKAVPKEISTAGKVGPQATGLGKTAPGTAAALGDPAIEMLLEGLDKAASPGVLSPLERVAEALKAGNRDGAVAIVRDQARQKFEAIKAKAGDERQNIMSWFGEFQAVEQLASLVYSADFGEQIKDVMSRTPGTYAMFGNGEGVLFTGLLDVLKTAVSGEATRRIDAAVEEEIGKMTDEERAALRDILNEARAALEAEYKGKKFVLGINYNDRQKQVVTKTLEKFAGFIDRYILLSETGPRVIRGEFTRPVQVVVVSKNTVDRAVAQASRGALGRLLYLFTADLGLQNRIANFAMRANIDEIGREEDQALAYETVLTALFSAGLVKSDKELETMSAEELEKLIGELPGSFQIGFERGKDGAFNVQVLALVASLIAMAKERAAVAKAA